MELHKYSQGESRRVRAPFPGGPSAEVLIGADGDWPLGVAIVTIPAGGGMPEHDHGSSRAMVLPLDGEVVMVDAERGSEHVASPGSVVTIPVGKRVEVRNDGSDDVSIQVVFDPPDFTRQLEAWPADEA
jgi:quercetin dioxygenase-like cupin family protein